MFGPYTFGMAGGARPTTTGLLERGAELAHLEGAIAALGGDRGRAGHPGTCRDRKSALVRVLGEHAAGQGVQTLGARASELERDFGFGVVRQLLETRVIRAGGSERAEWHHLPTRS